MNIYDIAKIAGVSIATVSRVVNDSPRVSEKTKKRIRAVMEENNYTPNVFARGLGLDSMKTVGIVCPDVADAYMACVVSNLERGLKQYGYDCILYCSGHQAEKKNEAILLIQQKRIDALVLVGSTYMGSGKSEEALYIKDAGEKIPVFLMNGAVAGKNIYSIYSDDFGATYETTTNMLKAGCQKILFLCDSHSYSANRKLEGYETALKEQGMPILRQLRLYTKNEVNTVRDILLSRNDLEFDAVLATDDGLAVGAVKYANARKLVMPQEINIVGYNNSQLSLCCEPELSSIDNFPAKMCSVTIEYMMRLLGQGEEIPQRTELPCELVKRYTTCF